MNIHKLKSAALPMIAALAFAPGASAGTYKHITVDGSFADWAGVPVAYTQDPDTTLSIAYTNIFVANDENYLYLRLAISTSADPFTSFQNIFVDADTSSPGYSAGGYIGSEMLIQGGAGYQERNGGFNEGGINGLGWACLPSVPGTNFEFSISRAATYASDNAPVFTTNVLNFHFQGQTSGFVAVNEVPPGGVLTYNDTNTVVPSLPPGRLAVSPVSGNRVAIVWDTPATLQARGSLTGGSWTNVPAATSPQLIPAAGGQMYFRLSQ